METETKNENIGEENTVPTENANVPDVPPATTPVVDKTDENPVEPKENEIVSPKDPTPTETGAEVETPSHDDANDLHPGKGIDTDGDGNADRIVNGDGDVVDYPEPHVDAPEDYEGKVKLSDAPGDFVDKDEAIDLIKGSQINEHYKQVMIGQAEAGKFDPQYAEAYKRIRSAKNSGTIYRPGSDGL